MILLLQLAIGFLPLSLEIYFHLYVRVCLSVSLGSDEA